MLVEILKPTAYQGTKFRPAMEGEEPTVIEIDDDKVQPLIDGQWVKEFQSRPTKPAPKKTKPQTDE